MSVEVYQPKEVSLLVANVIPIDDWVSLTREDIGQSKFTLEEGVQGEVFTDIVGSDMSAITITLLQTSTVVKALTDIYTLQRGGVIGIPLTFTSQTEKSIYPVVILEGRPKKTDSAQGEAVTYRFLCTTQFNTSLLS